MYWGIFSTHSRIRLLRDHSNVFIPANKLRQKVSGCYVRLFECISLASWQHMANIVGHESGSSRHGSRTISRQKKRTVPQGASFRPKAKSAEGVKAFPLERLFAVQ